MLFLSAEEFGDIVKILFSPNPKLKEKEIGCVIKTDLMDKRYEMDIRDVDALLKTEKWMADNWKRFAEKAGFDLKDPTQKKIFYREVEKLHENLWGVWKKKSGVTFMKNVGKTDRVDKLIEISGLSERLIGEYMKTGERCGIVWRHRYFKNEIDEKKYYVKYGVVWFKNEKRNV